MFKQYIEKIYKPGKVTILGLIGQAGAGKTNHITPILQETAKELGINMPTLGLDSFFLLSSRERKEWLAEGWTVSESEGKRRENQIYWWDFNKAQESINTLRNGESVLLSNVYNRKDKGELSGEVHVKPSKEGAIVLFDGVAVAHLENIDRFWYIHASNETRFNRLFMRDSERRDASEEAKKRWEITQRFEQEYYVQNWDKVNLLIDNSENGSGPPKPLENFPHFSELI